MNSGKKLFGKVDDKEIFLFTFENDHGLKFSITNYGGIVTHLYTPDINGNLEDIVLGFDNLEQYVQSHSYFGAIIGRYGNRISSGKFTLDNKIYTLAQNNDTNHLHGGIKGFDKVVWDYEEIAENDAIGLELSYTSNDGEEGYPGTVKIKIKCYINNNNELVFDYAASTDKATIINLTHHGYFNLNGMKKDIQEHKMEINADQITEVNDKLIPTGQFVDVTDTPFDFRISRAIGEKINEAGGYDHNYVLNKNNSELSFAAKVINENTGRVMEVYTTEPGMQFYSSNFLDGSLKGKNNIVYHKHYAFCLETQHFPDSPNQPNFPSTKLLPGEKYTQKTIYKFSTC